MARSEAPAGAPFLPAALGALGAQRPATSATASAAAAVHAIQLFLLRVMTLSPFSAYKSEIRNLLSGLRPRWIRFSEPRPRPSVSGVRQTPRGASGRRSLSAAAS